jgi:hypothetical protein
MGGHAQLGKDEEGTDIPEDNSIEEVADICQQRVGNEISSNTGHKALQRDKDIWRSNGVGPKESEQLKGKVEDNMGKVICNW